MTGRLSTVERGKHLDTTDEALSKPSVELLLKLEKTPPGKFTAFGRQFLKLSSDPKDVHHIEKEFLGDDPSKASFPPKGAIPRSDTKLAILHAAYIQALRVALYNRPDANPPTHERSEPLPIVTYWIAGVPQFEVYVSLSSTDREVHVLILTPTPHREIKPPPYGGRPENIWAIATNARIEELRNKIPETYGRPNVTEINGTRCQKLMSYT